MIPDSLQWETGIPVRPEGSDSLCATAQGSGDRKNGAEGTSISGRMEEQVRDERR